MATLKKGISFRRQGSSGLVWADEAIFADDGTLLIYHQKQGRKLRPNPTHGLGNTSSGSDNPNLAPDNPSHGLDNPSLGQKNLSFGRNWHSHGHKNPSHGQNNHSHAHNNPSRSQNNPGRGIGLRSKSESASYSRKPRSGVVYWLKKVFNVHT